MKLEVRAEAVTSNDVFTARVRVVGGYKVKRGRGQRRNRRHAHGPVSSLRFGFGRFVDASDDTQHTCFPRGWRGGNGLIKSPLGR